MAQRKTTLMLDEQVLASFKARAAQAGRSLSSLVEEAMRVFERREESPARPERWTLPTLGGGRPLPDIDWTSNAAIEDFLDADLPAEKRRWSCRT